MKIITIGDSPSIEGPAGFSSSPKKTSVKLNKTELSFNSFDVNENGEPNQSLVRGKAVCEAITELLVNNKGKLGQPFILCLNGNTGTGKTMLIDIIKSRLLAAGISCIDKRYDKYLLMEHELSDTMKSDVIFIDDFLNDINQLNDVKSKRASNSSLTDYLGFARFLSYLIKNNKVLVMSSNFVFADILQFITENDTQRDLTDEMKDFLSSVQPIELIREQSYRKILAKKGNILQDNLIKPIVNSVREIIVF